MKKRLLPIFFLILLAFGLALPVSAAENSIDDDAQLLTPDQINQLKQEIQIIIPMAMNKNLQIIIF